MRPLYIWQQPNWAAFTWDNDQLITLLSDVRNLQGRVLGLMSGLGFTTQNTTSLNVIAEEVLRSSEIEGELLDAERVRSSIAKHLGIDTEGLPAPDHYTDGVVEVMMDAIKNNQEPLTHERLFSWHAALFPTGRNGMHRITVAAYRTGVEPMQVVSGAMGKEKVHYEAPASDVVPTMMDEFITWINASQDIDPYIKAAVAHLWFVAIHPFDDGNGRITRTITDMLLTKADGTPHRFFSMSAEILRTRKEYYAILEKTTRGTLDITAWVEWFLQTLRNAILQSERTIQKVIKKSLFWQEQQHITMNERQTKMVNKLWDGFEGKLTSSKWAKITKTSQPTAQRDIADLVQKGVLIASNEGGRSTHYLLKEE
ncbi:MAG: Fic family protein [Paludibacteraceae bacterium]|nr:Fic family protein [Paludibacteraceae bacterium]